MSINIEFHKTYTPEVLERVFSNQPVQYRFPRVDNREAWTKAAETLGPKSGQLIAEAEVAAKTPIPSFPATDYLDFKRTGRRQETQVAINYRRTTLRVLAMAECIEDQGRFLDPLLDLIWATCEESIWCRPAHDPDLPDVTDPTVDLMTAMTAFELAEVDALLGGRLEPALGPRIRHEVDRRAFVPFLAMEQHHWLFSTPRKQINNWSAVCNGGILGAALYLEDDPKRLATIVHKGLRSLDDYISGFDVDGGTSEASFCWSFGFGCFTMLADLIEHRSDAQITLWNDRTRLIAGFPLRTQIGLRRFVNFSDSEIHFNHNPELLAYLATRLNMPDLMRIASHQLPNPRATQMSWAIRECFWSPEEDMTPYIPGVHDWFRGLQWMFSRQDPEDPDAMVLAIKGGHNREMHNQNDIGHFTLDVWNEPLLVDLGKSPFDRKYFKHHDGRYDFIVAGSQGHSVPVVNGYTQSYGIEHCAKVLDHSHGADEDRVEYDIAAAYPDEAGLQSLTRLCRFDRIENLIEMLDTFHFAETTGDFESVVICLRPVEVDGMRATILGDRGGVEISVHNSNVSIEVEELPGVELEKTPETVRRIRFIVQGPVKDGQVRLSIRPVAANRN